MQRHSPSFVRAVVRWAWVPVVSIVLVVAVAMGCAVWSPLLRSGNQFDSFDNTYFAIPETMRKYGDGLGGYERKGWGVSRYSINFRAVVTVPSFDTNEDTRRVEGVEIYVGRSGFPFRCMRWRYSLYQDMDDFSPFIIGIETARPFSNYRLMRRIPLMPEPVGLVLNMLIVSAAIVPMRLAWRRAVVARRRRKSLCVNCRYPVEPAVTICPECGRAYVGAKETEASHA